jgi:hypothetical protein
MNISLNEASRATGIPKSSLHRAIKNGHLSASRNDRREWQIEPSELQRYAESISRSFQMEQQDGTRNTPGTAVLSEKIASLESQLRKEEETVKDLRVRLDLSESERRELTHRITYLITDQTKDKDKSNTVGIYVMGGVVLLSVLVIIGLSCYYFIVKSQT